MYQYFSAVSYEIFSKNLDFSLWGANTNSAISFNCTFLYFSLLWNSNNFPLVKRTKSVVVKAKVVKFFFLRFMTRRQTICVLGNNSKINFCFSRVQWKNFTFLLLLTTTTTTATLLGKLSIFVWFWVHR